MARLLAWDQYNKAFTIAGLHFEDGVSLAMTDWQKAVILTLDPKPTTGARCDENAQGIFE